MKSILVLLTLLFGSATARADQIDVLLAGYANAAAACVDPQLASYCELNNGTPAWNTSVVFPGIQIWNTTQDTTVGGVVSHQFQSGFALIVSYADPTANLGAARSAPNLPSAAPWKADANTVLIADRDAATAANPNFILYSTQTNAQLTPLRLQPTPAGANYPFGGK